jgi:hypothetical protein
MVDEDFDLGDFRIVDGSPSAAPKTARSNRRPTRRGPIRPFIVTAPLDWEAEAARLPGKTLHVARALWYLSGLSKTRDGIKMQARVLSQFGVSHQSYNRCLKRLESAGLVRVERHAGQTPIVSILDA